MTNNSIIIPRYNVIVPDNVFGRYRCDQFSADTIGVKEIVFLQSQSEFSKQELIDYVQDMAEKYETGKFPLEMQGVPTGTLLRFQATLNIIGQPCRRMIVNKNKFLAQIVDEITLPDTIPESPRKTLQIYKGELPLLDAVNAKIKCQQSNPQFYRYSFFSRKLWEAGYGIDWKADVGMRDNMLADDNGGYKVDVFRTPKSMENIVTYLEDTTPGRIRNELNPIVSALHGQDLRHLHDNTSYAMTGCAIEVISQFDLAFKKDAAGKPEITGTDELMCNGEQMLQTGEGKPQQPPVFFIPPEGLQLVQRDPEIGRKTRKLMGKNSLN